MGSLLIIFAGCVAFVLMGLYFWEKREDEAYSQTLDMVRGIKGEYKKYDERQTELETTVKNYTELVKELDAKVEACDAKLTGFKEETDVFRDQVADTREKQMKLREALAAKTPKIELKVPQGPFLVELYSKPGTGRPTAPKGQGAAALVGNPQAPNAPPAGAPPLPTYAPTQKPMSAKQKILEAEKAAAEKRKTKK